MGAASPAEARVEALALQLAWQAAEISCKWWHIRHAVEGIAASIRDPIGVGYGRGNYCFHPSPASSESRPPTA